MVQVAFTLNGAATRADVEPRTSLAEYLRGPANLTATHLGCEHGVCGACTIVVDGAPARACITFTATLEGASVQTLEGLLDDPVMQKMQAAFHEEHALQCGFCTPGMLITSRDIVGRLAHADEKRIRCELAGNLCRCTGYVGIVKAVQRVLVEMPAEARLRKATPVAAVSEPLPIATTAAATAAMPAVPSTRNTLTVPTAPAAPADAKGWTRVEDGFVVDRDRGQVWELFGDTAAMARCLPGFELESEQGDVLTGVMRVAFGPIKAGFACTATIERDPARFTGAIRGNGIDERGGSRARGQVTYRLLETEEGRTRVAVALDYALQGPLAQFSRSGLVRDFTSRLIAAFARNLSGLMLGQAAQPSAALGVGAMLWASLRDRVRRWFKA